MKLAALHACRNGGAIYVSPDCFKTPLHEPVNAAISLFGKKNKQELDSDIFQCKGDFTTIRDNLRSVVKRNLNSLPMINLVETDLKFYWY